MKRISLAFAAALLAGTALGQGSGSALAQTTPGNTAPGATSNAPMPGVSTNTGVIPGTGVVDRNTGAAAASGDRNQAVTTTSTNAAEPARGSNSFSEGEARRRLESNGFASVGALTKDDGVWRGTATKDGQSVRVWLDYKGNTGQQGGMPQAMSTPDATNLDGTTGNQPGTVAGRVMDRTLGTNTTGANPTGTSAATTRQ